MTYFNKFHSLFFSRGNKKPPWHPPRLNPRRGIVTFGNFRGGILPPVPNPPREDNPPPFIWGRVGRLGTGRSQRPTGACFANNWNVTQNQFTTLGYSTERARRLDQLYFIGIEKDGKPLIKIGRTFYGLEKRFEEEDLQIVYIFGIWKATHQKIYEVEQMVLKEFEQYKYACKPFNGSSECFQITLPVYQVILFIKDKLPEAILIAGGETQNQSQCTPPAQKRKSIHSKIKTANPKANSQDLEEALQWQELLLDIPVFTKFIMALDKKNLSGEASTLLKSFYSVSVGIIFLSVLAHAAEQNGIAKTHIARRPSYKWVNSCLVGKSPESKLIKAFYSQQETVKDALEKRVLKKKLIELYDLLMNLSQDQEASDSHRRATQALNGKIAQIPIWHPNTILPNVDPQTIDVDKAFELITNALTQANKKLTKLYIAESFDINESVMIDHCSELLKPTTFVEDFEQNLVLAQELGCC
eukprot:TRINITY_DN34165_c0_g2_i1.p1 TRINITY_DN34165_c0_g2~~TRINITY_DN34165_c0_g2_i1.p1  ORF type:complete len:471 (-),score=26.51 TRINITY_DN34165_c0_g2_i1:209-1621(-)